MRRVALVAVGLLLSALLSGSFRAETKAPPREAAAKRVRPFTLPDAFGKEWSWADLTRGPAKAVVFFLGTECPVNNAYLPRLAELHREYAARGVTFVAIN